MACKSATHAIFPEGTARVLGPGADLALLVLEPTSQLDPIGRCVVEAIHQPVDWEITIVMTTHETDDIPDRDQPCSTAARPFQENQHDSARCKARCKIPDALNAER
jgi:hypothetical protein